MYAILGMIELVIGLVAYESIIPPKRAPAKCPCSSLESVFYIFTYYQFVLCISVNL